MNILKLQSASSLVPLCVLLLAGPQTAFSQAGVSANQPSADQRPNLVFVMSDQHSWDMLGCYGNSDLKTPHFDRLAREGIRFNHCVSNSPLCTPYRGILMSSRHPLETGAMVNDVQMLPGNGTYLGEVLRDAGYRMGYFGKWHLYGGERVRSVPAGPFRYGFDHEFLTNNCTLLFDADRAYYWDPQGRKQLYGAWEPYAQTKQAIEFIKQHAKRRFALFLAWHPPHNWGRKHAGYSAPDDMLDLYDPATLHLRPTVADNPEIRLKYQGHMAMISSLDRAFGELLQTLDELELTENTLVIFTSDHGDMLMSYGWPNFKGRAEDGSCRVPLLVRYPTRLQHRVSELLIGTFDLMPTILGLMGLPIPQTCRGLDLTDAILHSRDDAVQSQPLFLLPANWRGIYTRRYTYSFSVAPDAPPPAGLSYNILYDRTSDPWQQHNLFESADHKQIRRELHQATLKSMARFGDTGFHFQELLRRVVRAEDWPAVGVHPRFRPKGWEGRLRGRPIDFLPLPDYAKQKRELLAGLEVRPAEIATVERERHQFPEGPPRGWGVGAKLQRLRPRGPNSGVPAPHAVDADSIIVRRQGKVLVQGRDYLVDPTYGTLGLGPHSSIRPADEVEVDYRFSLRRIDSIVETSDGTRIVKEGRSHLTAPLPPTLATGEKRLGNLFVDYFDTAETAELFLIEESSEQVVTWTTPGRIPRTLAKLRSGKPVKIVCWGDSVTVGGDASGPEHRYVSVFERMLRAKFPQADITVKTVAFGGSNSRQWLDPNRFPGRAPQQTRWQRIIDEHPDLVTVEFVNDAGMTFQQVNSIYADITRRLQRMGAEVIFIAPHFTMPEMMRMKSLRDLERRQYVLALRAFANRRNLAVADASSRWAHLWQEGIPYVTLLKNGINHPDDRGHLMFAEELIKCFD